MIGHYDWAGGREALLRFGPVDGPVVIVALPLFEEANRTRAFTVAILRALAARGIGGVLPDLPGTGESLVATENATLTGWRAAFAAAAGAIGARYAVAIRSGALVDTDAAVEGRWHFAPQDGSALSRELARMQQGTGPVMEIAGNRVSRALLDALVEAEPARTARTIRLISDPAPANRRIDAAPLWRRVEPDTDRVLSQSLADDIAEWIATCGG